MLRIFFVLLAILLAAQPGDAKAEGKTNVRIPAEMARPLLLLVRAAQIRVRAHAALSGVTGAAFRARRAAAPAAGTVRRAAAAGTCANGAALRRAAAGIGARGTALSDPLLAPRGARGSDPLLARGTAAALRGRGADMRSARNSSEQLGKSVEKLT